MRGKAITVEVAPDGGIKIEGHGFTGPGCEQATKFLEDALGVTGDRTKKREYAEQEVQRVKARQ